MSTDFKFKKGSIVRLKDGADPWRVMECYGTAFGPSYTIESRVSDQVITRIEQDKLVFHRANWTLDNQHEYYANNIDEFWKGNNDDGTT